MGHILLKKSVSFGISALMQEQMCFIGQLQVFDEAADSFDRMTGVKVSSTQIQRVCHYYGQQLEESIQKSIAEGGKDRKAVHKGPCYVMLDGGMVLTRDDQWKEMKLGRLFDTAQSIEISKDRGCIGDSLYVAHLGNHREFLKKMEYHVDTMSEVIFIADGAPWIWKWIETMYPEATQILDFYHAKEHLCQWAEIAFAKAEDKDRWIDCQSLLLLNDKVEEVIKNIGKRPAFSNIAKEKKQSLINYFTTHKERMKYRTFRSQGLMIGSGPIEAAHKHVIQQRMKLSGQRWTKKGAQQIANLRVTYRSNNWIDIIDLVKKAA